MMRQSCLRAVGAALGLVLCAAALGAQGTQNRLEYLTFSGPVALPGVVLAPGEYAFEIANPMTNRDIVRVSDAATRSTRFLGMTQRAVRPPDAASNVHVQLGEARPGGAAPILAWYPMYDSGGRQFIYR
jgi:hypothetical protein